jgi:5-methylcytosine-specific restriction endonuclease McrA
MTAATNRYPTMVYWRDDWKCRHCNDRSNLHPHHVIFRSQQGTDDMNNILTLCAQCHRAVHDGKLKIEVISTTEDNLVVRFTRVKGWKPT